MARGKKNGAATVGDNSGGITEDERADLIAYYGSKARAAIKKAATKKAEYDAEREGVNSVFSSARGDLGITRKDFELLLAAQDMSEGEFLAAEAKRLELYRLGGLPVGTQLDMFERKDTADEKQLAYASGKRAGLRGDDPECPDTVAAILRPEWEHGWAQGQQELGDRMIRAQALLEAKAAKKPVLTAGEDPDEPEDEVDHDAEARKLKKAGWTEPTAEERSFEDAAA